MKHNPIDSAPIELTEDELSEVMGGGSGEVYVVSQGSGSAEELQTVIYQLSQTGQKERRQAFDINALFPRGLDGRSLID
jgi:hypothetical protein